MKKIVIIGAVAAGASAAARARRLDENVEIIMLDRGGYISFANCGLPYHIGNEIKNRDELVLQTPNSFKKRFNVDVRLHNDVIDIDENSKNITIKDTQTNKTYQETYDYLLLAPGAAPFVPPIENINSVPYFTLRNIPDMDRILSFIESNQVTKASVIGGGFIGVEMAEALRTRGIEQVDLIEMQNQIMAPVDCEIASPLHEEMQKNKVNLHLKRNLIKVEKKENAIELHLNNEEKITTQLLILAIGVKPETTLAKKANLKLGNLGGIKVDEYMQTSNKFIFAAGDAIENINLIDDNPCLIPLAGPANRQGRIAAQNIINGKTKKYKKTQGSAVARVFSLTVASTGFNEKQLQQKNIAYEKIYIHPLATAGYFPRAKQMTFKLLFSLKTGEIFGAQAIGEKGITKRIDLISLAIRAKMKVFDLEDFEPCYAPPFNNAKDVLNQAGFVASHLFNKETKIFHTEDIKTMDQEKQVLLDVREEAELMRSGTIKNATNISVDNLRNSLEELDKDKEYLVFCQVGIRGYLACNILKLNGFKAKNLSGGFKTYQMVNQKHPTKPLHFDS